MDSNTINAISLCSGYEGIGLGIRRVLPNLRVVAYSEIEEYACSVLAARMEQGLLDVAPIWTDLKTFPGEAFHSKVHGIFGGYPCQPWSHAGKRQGEDDPRHLFPHIAKIVRAVQPVWCFFENVAGHLSLGFPSVYRSLRDMDYQVEAGLFTASMCGAPHRRQRLFILAHDDSDRFSMQSRRITTSAARGTKSQQCLTWPAPPGQPQYEWEEPRVVGDATKRNVCGEQERGIHAGEETEDRRETNNDNAERPDQQRHRQAQPSVGQSVDGRQAGVVRHRVDQLRLLGNGVVPAQAELAFRTLWNI